MNVHDAAAYLLRFDAPPILAPEANSPSNSIEIPPPESEEPSIDPLQMRMELEASFAEALHEERRAHAEELSNARERWTQEQARSPQHSDFHRLR